MVSMQAHPEGIKKGDAITCALAGSPWYGAHGLVNYLCLVETAWVFHISLFKEGQGWCYLGLRRCEFWTADDLARHALAC